MNLQLKDKEILKRNINYKLKNQKLLYQETKEKYRI